MMVSMETFFVASHFFSKNGRKLHICKEIPKLLSALRLHMLLHCRSLDLCGCTEMYRIYHIYIVEMNTVENSTYQVSVVDNVHSSPHLARNLSIAMRCYVYLFLSK